MDLDWEYQVPHPGYTAGRVWLNRETMIDRLVDRFEEVRYNVEVRNVLRADDGTAAGARDLLTAIAALYNAIL